MKMGDFNEHPILFGAFFGLGWGLMQVLMAFLRGLFK
jgi:hypothetical protein